MTDYVQERILPEVLTGVPERSAVSEYRGSLGRLALVLSPYKGFPTYDYDLGNILRDVYLDTEDIGVLNLHYDYQHKTIGISSIRLDESKVRQGIGTAIYKTVLQLPLPSGENPRQEGFVFESTCQSEAARNVWAKLVKHGEATQHSRNHFRMR